MIPVKGLTILFLLLMIKPDCTSGNVCVCGGGGGGGGHCV